MISNLGWICLIGLALIVALLVEPNSAKECYDRSIYKCMNCKKDGCKYHKMANRIDEIIDERMNEDK